MAQTVIGLNDPKAVKRYSGFLAVDVAKTSYFNKKFMGKGEASRMPIQQLTDLESESGDTISYDLIMQLKMQPIEGDTKLAGKEEKLQFYTDSVKIDQMRGGVNGGGKMTRKRTIHDLRAISKPRQAEWWSRVFDELLFIYLSGARGVNAGFVFPTTYTGFANNTVSAPDSDHLLYGGDATAKNNVDANDVMTTKEIDRAVAYATMMGGEAEGIPQIQPILVDGEEHYVCIMNPWQVYDLRRDTGAAGWLEIQKAASAATGENSNIFKGKLGIHNGTVLHEHKSIIRFSDYGSGANVEAARALFLGAQAAVVAFGSPGAGLRYQWREDEDDRGNEVIITTSSILGVKKTTFNSKDFGVMAIDTAAKKP